MSRQGSRVLFAARMMAAVNAKVFAAIEQWAGV